MKPSPTPLKGVRVLELCSVLAGPFAGALLQRLGAEVVKIESPIKGDPYRSWGAQDSPHFVQFNTGKKSLAIDLGDRRGTDAVKQLLPTLDVLLHNSRPGRMERLGLSSNDCLAVNPRLVWVGLTGFGTVGPLASHPAYDSIAASAAGLYDALAPNGQRPSPGPALGDMASGLLAAMGALVGLMSRERTGRGIVIETSMLDAIITLIGDALTYFLANGESLDSPQRCAISQMFFPPCADGRYLTIHLSTSEKFFRNLLRVLGRDELAEDPRFVTYQTRREHHVALRAEIEPSFTGSTAGEWAKVLSDADVPASVVFTLGEVAEHPHVAAMGIIKASGHTVPLLRAPWTFDGVRPDIDAAVPSVGEHSRDVLRAVMADSEIDTLLKDGVLGDGEKRNHRQ